MDKHIEELKKAALEATQGDWWQDVVETKGTYGMGDDCHEGFHSYAVYRPDNNSLLDMTNSTAAIINTEDDGDYHMAWDETGRRNAKFIALANPTVVLALLAKLEAAEAELCNADFRGVEKLAKAFKSWADESNGDYEAERHWAVASKEAFSFAADMRFEAEGVSSKVDITCYSCRRFITFQQHAEADGFCPYCNVEIELTPPATE
ncbi:ead/Ea22-like family protein [Yersinia frederiksenii]|uniref:ead/Ea22-like family protein n=1 Tax=Yersinia frederiksenii TaxID=29484 RepID=UPI0005E8200D|nr:ead/Ea22-like family protein [Yersinia frederiksenii]CFR18113.1 Uncharacterised protein [Yersinia frederiksenii]